MSVLDEVKLLVCEGACNPNRLAIEAQAMEGAKMTKELGWQHGPYVKVLRQLQHTPHKWKRFFAGQRWACQMCGKERRYGG